MNITAIEFWLWFGAILVIGEVILPGLVSVFVGLGALTVAALLHYGYIDNISFQLVTWFVSSTVYLFSLRLLVMRFYPSDRQIQDIDEDSLVIGASVLLTEAILNGKPGRIEHGGSSWKALSADGADIPVGTRVTVVNRSNITWIVKQQ